MPFNLKLDPSIKFKYPSTRLGCLSGNIKVSEDTTELWKVIDTALSELNANLKIEDIAKIETIQHARKAYKSFGKDPARYRLSAEALLRRIVNGKGLYKINNIVDLLNLVSVKSGISIGGYDTQFINGDITLGIGKKEERYEAIGRGSLNIEFLPVLRDEESAFGSPTSDSKRTMARPTTIHFMMVFFDFGASEKLQEAMNEAENLMIRFASGNEMKQWMITSNES